MKLSRETRELAQAGAVLEFEDGFAVRVLHRFEVRYGAQITVQIIRDGRGARWSSVGRVIYCSPLSNWYGAALTP